MPDDPNVNAEPGSSASADQPPCLSRGLRPAPVMARSFAFAFVLFASTASAQEVFQNLYSPDGIVSDAAIAGDTLYVGGTFGFVGGSTGTVAVLDKETGAPDLTQPRFGGGVWEVIPDGAGGYFAGGAFSSVDGQPRRNLAHVLADGTLDPDFRPDPTGQINPDYFGSVETLFLHEGVLFVGGRFDFVGGQPRRNLAALDATTGALLPLSVTMQDDSGGGGDPRGTLKDIVVQDDIVYFAGNISEVNGESRRTAAAVRATTGELLAWDIQAEHNQGPGFVAIGALVFADSTLYVGGEFDRIRGLPRQRGVEVSLADSTTGDGGMPTPWVPELGVGQGSVVTPDYIWTVVYSAFHLMYRIDRRTGNAVPFVSNTPYGLAYAMAFDPTGGTAGTFYIAAGKPDLNAPRGRYNAVVAVDAATMQLTGYEVLAGVGTLGNDYTRSLAVTPGPDGRVIAGGEPTQYGGAPRRFLAGLDLTTGQLTGFGEDYIVFSSVDETTTSPDERFLYFTTFNGIGVGDLTTGELYAFPGGATLRETFDAHGGASDTLAVRRDGPVVARRDGTPAPAFRAPPPESLRTRGPGGARAVRGGTGALVASSERLYVHPEGGVVALDRATGATLWSAPFSESLAAPDVPKLLLVEGGPPGARGDTLFASGIIYPVDGDPARTRFVALDAETGAILDFATGTGPITSGTYGSGLAAVPGDGRIFLGGTGFSQAGGQPRRGLFAASRATGAVDAWNPNPGRAQASVKALAAQAGPDGRAAVVYAAEVRGVQPQGTPGTSPLVGAFDAATGIRLPWSMPVEGETPSFVLLAERQGWVVAGGSFGAFGPTSAGRSYLVAARPAVPFVPTAGEAVGLARAPSLGLAGPNPFRSRTALALSLPQAGHVSAALYDVLGRRVAVLHDGPLGAGAHRFEIDGSGLPAGVYVARVVGSVSASQTLTVVR